MSEALPDPLVLSLYKRSPHLGPYAPPSAALLPAPFSEAPQDQPWVPFAYGKTSILAMTQWVFFFFSLSSYFHQKGERKSEDPNNIFPWITDVLVSSILL